MRGGPRTPLGTTDPNLECAFVENAIVFVIPKIGTPPGLPITIPGTFIHIPAGVRTYFYYYYTNKSLYLYPFLGQ